MLNEIFAGFAFLIFSSIGKSPRVIISSFGGGSGGLVQLIQVGTWNLDIFFLHFCLIILWTLEQCETIMEPPKNTTRDIIASQNQDYVDEGLAEYQDQIQKLQCKFLKKLNICG